MPRLHRTGSRLVRVWALLPCVCAAAAQAQAQQAPAPMRSQATFEVRISAGLPAATLKSCTVGTLAAPDKGLATLRCLGTAAPVYTVIAHSAPPEGQAMPDGEPAAPEDSSPPVQSANPAGARSPRAEPVPGLVGREVSPPVLNGQAFEAVIFPGARSVQAVRAIEVVF